MYFTIWYTILKSNSPWFSSLRTWQCHSSNSCTVSCQNQHIWYAAFYNKEKRKTIREVLNWEITLCQGPEGFNRPIPVSPPCPGPHVCPKAIRLCPRRTCLQLLTVLPCTAMALLNLQGLVPRDMSQPQPVPVSWEVLGARVWGCPSAPGCPAPVWGWDRPCWHGDWKAIKLYE